MEEELQSTQESNTFALEFISPYKYVPTAPRLNEKITDLFKKMHDFDMKN